MYGQIKNRYPDDLWQEIIGNCDTRLELGTTDTLTAQYFCDLIGVSTVETESIRKSNSLEGAIEEYGQKNVSTLKRNLLNIDEIMRLPSNKLLVVLRGNKPLLLDKMIYKQHYISSKLTESSIYDYNPKWTKNNNSVKIVEKEKNENNKPKEKLGFDNF